MDVGETCPTTPKAFVSLRNPFSGQSEREHFPRFSPSVFRADGTPIGSRFQWSIDQIARLNPADICEEMTSKQMEAQRPRHEVDGQMQKEVDHFFATKHCVRSPWIPQPGKSAKHVTFSPLPPDTAYVSFHDEPMEDGSGADGDVDVQNSESTEMEIIQNMSFCTLKRKLFEDDWTQPSVEAIHEANDADDSFLAANYVGVQPLTPPTPGSSPRSKVSSQSVTPIQSSPLSHKSPNINLSPILSEEKKHIRGRLSFSMDSDATVGQRTPQKLTLIDPNGFESTPNRLRYDGIKEFPVRRLSEAKSHQLESQVYQKMQQTAPSPIQEISVKKEKLKTRLKFGTGYDDFLSPSKEELGVQSMSVCEDMENEEASLQGRRFLMSTGYSSSIDFIQENESRQSGLDTLLPFTKT